jgi:hypothetical protein
MADSIQLDFDMTLALIGDPDPYDAITYDRDTLNAAVSALVSAYQQANPTPIGPSSSPSG